MNRSSRATIQDVANIAGVSRGTVSRYLNGSHWVSVEASQRISEAIEKTHYVANSHAIALATGRTNSVAFLLGEPQDILFEDPNFATLLRSVADELGKRNMSFILMTMNDKTQRERDLAYLSGGHVDGVILVAWHHDASELIQDLLRLDIPTVIAEQPRRDIPSVSYVHVDDYASARNACEYLLQCGGKHFGMIAGPKGPSGTTDRVRGFLETMGSRYQDQIVYGDYSQESGFDGMNELLERYPEVDSVFAANDRMAVGAIKALHAKGLLIPQVVQIIGFDDAAAAQLADPPLTTLRQPFDKIGKYLVDLLIKRVKGEDPTGIILPCSLVVRESTRELAS